MKEFFVDYAIDKKIINNKKTYYKGKMEKINNKNNWKKKGKKILECVRFFEKKTIILKF